MTSGDRVTARDRVIETARALFRVVRNVLHEIFDEAAYERFLRRTKAARTRQSYRAFQLEREFATEQKPRCC